MEYNTTARGPNIELKNRLEEASRAADELLVSQDAAHADEARLHEILKEYVRIRFLLTEEDVAESEHFKYLGELSIARGLGVSTDKVRKTELDSKCAGTSSAMTKKILLVVALGKALGIKTDPDRNADITTISELSHEVRAILDAQGGEGDGRIS